MHRSIAVIIFLSLFAGILYAQDVPPEYQLTPNQALFLKKAQVVGEALNKHDVDGLEMEFDKMLQRELPPEKLKVLMYTITDSLGFVEKIGTPKMKWKNVALIPFQLTKGIFDLQLGLDSFYHITGFLFLYHKPDLKVPERNAVMLKLPFKGKWDVVWGGDTKELNYHHDIKSQMYAVDFNITDEVGKSHFGDGAKNEDFFAFGKEILAPADGIVTEAIDGVRDNPPFTANEFSAVGNCVIIQHSDSEVSVIAHLKQGSVRVKAGEHVKQGQVIGLCGNSGSSTQPQVHFHFQNTPLLGEATGVKAYFENVIVTRKKEAPKKYKEYAPLRDEKVQNEE